MPGPGPMTRLAIPSPADLGQAYLAELYFNKGLEKLGAYLSLHRLPAASLLIFLHHLDKFLHSWGQTGCRHIPYHP